jgi:GT2 family glycosyltransferase
MTPTPTVSIVVLSYNRPDFLRQALSSILAQTHRPAEVTVVDNRSARSAEVAGVVAEFPGVRLIANPDNRGFTGGMNSGLRAASGEYVCLTEDDVALAPDYLASVLGYVHPRPEVGVAAGVLFHPDGRTVLCGGAEAHLGTRFSQKLNHAGRVGGVPEADPFPVGFVPGSLVFARRSLLAKLGGFRPDFFMYYEDFDLCRRVADAGYRVVIVPTATARHLTPPGGGRRPAAVEFHLNKNFLAVYLLHAPARVLPEFALRYGPVAVLKTLFRDPAQARMIVRAWWHVLSRLGSLLRDRRRNARNRRRTCTEAAR